MKFPIAILVLIFGASLAWAEPPPADPDVKKNPDDELNLEMSKSPAEDPANRPAPEVAEQPGHPIPPPTPSGKDLSDRAERKVERAKKMIEEAGTDPLTHENPTPPETLGKPKAANPKPKTKLDESPSPATP